MSPLLIYLAYISPKNSHTLVYNKSKTDFTYLLLHQSQKKSKKTNQTNPCPPLKLHKITDFLITNKINLPLKAKVSEKNLVEISRE